MFFIELMAARFEIFAFQSQDLEAVDPSMDLLKGSGSEEEKAGSNIGTRECK